MVERKHGTQNHAFTINNILPEQHVKVYQQIAGEFGVEITVLASAGQNYTETRLDQQGEKYTYEGIVPEGNMQVEIAYSTQNLSRFYDRAGQVLAKMETSKNRTQS